MNYDAIQKELEQSDSIITVMQEPKTEMLIATCHWLGSTDTAGEPHPSLPDALHSLNQALKEEQDKPLG